MSKVVLVGDKGVGKTTFVKRMMSGDYVCRYIPTMGIEVHRLELDEEGTKFVNLWDITGDDKFSGLRSYCYKDASLVLVFFTEKAGIDTWVQETHKYAPKAKIVLVHNKVDLGRTFKADFPCMLYSTRSCWNYTKMHKLLEQYSVE